MYSIINVIINDYWQAKSLLHEYRLKPVGRARKDKRKYEDSDDSDNKMDN